MGSDCLGETEDLTLVDKPEGEKTGKAEDEIAEFAVMNVEGSDLEAGGLLKIELRSRDD